MSEAREHGWCVEHEDDANMRTTSTEGFLVGISEWKMENNLKNESVGDASEDHVWDNSHHRHSKAISDIDGDVSTGKSGHPYMLTVCVRVDTCPAEWQMHHQKNNRQNNSKASTPMILTIILGVKTLLLLLLKSLQSCPTLCDPIVSSPPGSAVKTLAYLKGYQMAM